jgi:D-alanine--poly(phosphoribitol) ligase subunit 2
MEHSEVLEIVQRSCQQHADLQNSKVVQFDATTQLFGEEALFDSMGLIALIIDVEEALSEELNSPVALLDEKAMSRKNSPFRTIGTLVEYIVENY